jgi:hypothetical protein
VETSENPGWVSEGFLKIIVHLLYGTFYHSLAAVQKKEVI